MNKGIDTFYKKKTGLCDKFHFTYKTQKNISTARMSCKIIICSSKKVLRKKNMTPNCSTKYKSLDQ